MTEEAMEFQSELKEKSLIAKTGKTRGMKQSWYPSKERIKEMSGECKIWPNFPSLRYRILWLAGEMKQVDFAKKVGISEMTASRLYNGKPVGKDTIKAVAIAFNAPIDWLTGSEKEEKEENSGEKEMQLGVHLSVNGEMNGAKIKQILCALIDTDVYNVNICIKGD